MTLEFSDRYQAVALPIQLYTMSWVTHVDFVLPDGRLLGATPFGVRIRKWTPAIHTVRYTFNADAEKVLGFALSQLGKPYDYAGLSGYALKISLLHLPGSWFCSALVEAAALQDGVDLSGKSPRFTSPAQIKASRLLVRDTRERTNDVRERTYVADRRTDQPAPTRVAYVLPQPTPQIADTLPQPIPATSLRMVETGLHADRMNGVLYAKMAADRNGLALLDNRHERLAMGDFFQPVVETSVQPLHIRVADLALIPVDSAYGQPVSGPVPAAAP